MKRCGACGKTIRSGKMAFASDGHGGIVRKRLGPCCYSDTVPVLIGDIQASRCSCGKPATTCVACVRDGEKSDPKKVLEHAIKKIRNTAKAYKRAWSPASDLEAAGIIDGLGQAADILEGGDY